MSSNGRACFRRPLSAAYQADGATGAWQALGGLSVEVYEIHHGRSRLRPDMLGAAPRLAELQPGLAWLDGSGLVLGCYWHGLFENASVLQALWGLSAPTLDQVFARLAEGVGQWFARP